MASLASTHVFSIKLPAGLIPLAETKPTKVTVKSAGGQTAVRSLFSGQPLFIRSGSRGILRSQEFRSRAITKSERSEFESEKTINEQGSDGQPQPHTWQQKVADILPGLPGLASSAVEETVRFFQRPAIVATLVASVLLSAPDFAMAAQGGGRVGGRNFQGSSSAGSQTYVAPAQTYVAPSFAAPYYAPSPFFGGWGWSPFFAPSPTIVVGGGGFGFGGIISVLLIGVVFMFVANAVTGFLSDGSDEGMFGVTEKTSVVRVQVGLLGMARTLQKDLDRIAERADTSSPEGLHYILTETVLSLLRHPDYCVYGRSTTDISRADDGGEAGFNRLSLEERGKFQSETLVSVDDVRRRVARPSKADRFTSEYIVVTILVAAEGEFQVPAINSTADLKQALTVLGSVPVDQLRAVEILWTPQDEEDTLSSQEMLTDYPQLRAL